MSALGMGGGPAGEPKAVVGLDLGQEIPQGQTPGTFSRQILELALLFFRF
jgi:hypothetical protein